MKIEITINLIFLLILFVALIIYFFVKFYYSRNYQMAEVPVINSRNSVISNHDVQNIISYFQGLFKLEEYEIHYEPTKNFLSLNKGFVKHKKQIFISQSLFNSVGYEIDHILSNLWLAKKTIEKDRRVTRFCFVANYLVSIFIILFFAAFFLQLLFFIVIVARNSDISNKFIKTIWEVPVLGIIAFIFVCLTLTTNVYLNTAKPYMEESYNQDVILEFKNNFLNFFDDLRIAREYDSSTKIVYNFALKNVTQQNGQIKWFGPFVKY